MLAAPSFRRLAHAPAGRAQIEEEEPTGFIRFEKFERMMSRILLENQYPRDSEDKLLRAFRTLDPDNKGYIEAEKLRNLLTTHGERFSQAGHPRAHPRSLPPAPCAAPARRRRSTTS